MSPFSKSSMSICTSLVIALAGTLPTAALGGGYLQHNLVSDGFVPADHLDANIVNAWGVALNPFGPAWVADNGAGVSTLYDGSGNPQPATPQPLVVQIPAPGNPAGGGTPTGVVFNGSNAFAVAKPGGAPSPSRFLFATEDGLIAGWAPAVDLTHAVVAVDSSGGGAVYKGIAISAGGSGVMVYASDFHNARVDVFDGGFQPVSLAAGAFTDPDIPAGFAPFGMQAIGGDIYVSYAMQDAARHDDVKGRGLGYVDVFDPNGRLIRRVVTRGRLNAPWGMALAPAGFGRFADRLLVGNFGDGLINAYDPASGEFVGQLRTANDQPIQIDGLWGIAFGNGLLGQPVNTLFFAAGPADEAHGLYGRIDVVPGE